MAAAAKPENLSLVVHGPGDLRLPTDPAPLSSEPSHSPGFPIPAWRLPRTLSALAALIPAGSPQGVGAAGI
ncbi:hypothetical protein P7K49_017510 [Saguinus oedipus]|uniref:Uncharacterized protein n=1 Tax=Saguinus oedipus TaxID=9490 RepID=A0ABQ9V2Q8_SAGOE|nr:hypothetical protein P7K49_017510 [Saguinus oedipus]